MPGFALRTRDVTVYYPLRRKISSNLMPQFAKNLEIRSASFGNTAGMIGAALHFCEQTEIS
ncbi:MAG: hypothetical protein WCD89_04490 [Anaerocolumna sp.]